MGSVRERILVSWIGDRDFWAMASALGDPLQARVHEVIGKKAPSDVQVGPTRTLLAREAFTKIHLLSNRSADITQEFAKWLGGKPRIHQIELTDPTDYFEVYEASDTVLDRVTEGVRTEAVELCIHLSPGTPTMAAIWVLLGKSKYRATFFQTFGGQAWETRIPFDIVVDALPRLFQGPDANLAALASRTPGETPGFEDISGRSEGIRLVSGVAARVAMRDVSLLITGESGTGKERWAYAIHRAGPRCGRAFQAVNCAALPTTLLESELFGHVRGAFTDAKSGKDGLFKGADGGTLFLDEIGECDPAMQAKLLRVLQPPVGASSTTRTFRPLGSNNDQTADVRVIAATNRNLLADVGAGRFREDLYYRLAVFKLRVPSLRERRSDIPELAGDLLLSINREFAEKEPGYRPKTLSQSATEFLSRQPWPGNIRQLNNVLVQAAVLTDREALGPEDLKMAALDAGGAHDTRGDEIMIGEGFSLRDHLESIQRRYVIRAMQDANGVKVMAARLLGIKNYQTLDGQLKRLGIRDWG